MVCSFLSLLPAESHAAELSLASNRVGGESLAYGALHPVSGAPSGQVARRVVYDDVSDSRYDRVPLIDRNWCGTIRTQRAPEGEATNLEECSLCDTIVTNARRYKAWVKASDVGTLCTGVPHHLHHLCRYYACKLIACNDFVNDACSYFTPGGVAKVSSPCENKYICWNCLNIPQRSVRGCFDGLDEGFD